MKKTILLLEDDRQLNDTVCQFLEYHGYAIYQVYDGYEAEEIVYERHIDMMLLDIRVPRLDGFAFLKKLRDEGSVIPAIYISSLNSVEDVTKGFAIGCEDYIRKPFALKELLVRIESLLSRHHGAQKSTVGISDGVVFDLRSLALHKDGSPVALRTKELKLLRLFLQRQGELLDYQAIYEALWEYDEEPSSASLRTYIKSLRAAIGKEKIVTVKNIGYRFAQE